MRVLGALLFIALGVTGCNTTTNPSQVDVSGLKGKAANAFAEYSSTGNFKDFRSFHYDQNSGRWGRSWGFATPEEAIETSRESCNENGIKCQLYAVGDTIVYDKSQDQIAVVKAAYRDKYGLNSRRLAKSGKFLKKNEIIETVSGKDLKGESFSGQKFLLKFHKSGKLDVRLLNINADVRKTDSGQWWMTQDKICRQLEFFFQGKKECFSVYKDKVDFSLINGDGKIAARFELTEISPKGDTDLAQRSNNATQASQSAKKLHFTKKQSYNVGTRVGYSELCTEYRGSGAPNLAIRSIKNYFDGNKDFNRGYERQAMHSGYDKISGLDDCDENVDKLVNFAKAIE